MSASRSAVGPERTRQQLQELDALLQQMLALPLAEKPESRSHPASGDPLEVVSEPAQVVEPPVRTVSPTPAAKPADRPVLKRLTPLLSLTPTREPGERGPIAAKQPSPLSSNPIRLIEEPASFTPPPAANPGLSVFVPEECPAARISTLQPGPARATALEAATSALAGAAADPLDPLRFDLAGPLDLDLSPDLEGEAAVFDSRDPEPLAEGEKPSRLSLAHQGLIGVNRVLETPFRMLGPVGRPFLSHTGRSFLGWLGLILLTGSAALALGVWLGWTW